MKADELDRSLREAVKKGDVQVMPEDREICCILAKLRDSLHKPKPQNR